MSSLRGVLSIGMHARDVYILPSATVKGIDTESLKELCRTNAVSHSMQDVDFCTSLDSICVVEVAQFLEEVLP